MIDVETEAMIAELRRENDQLRARVARLERDMKRYVLDTSLRNIAKAQRT